MLDVSCTHKSVWYWTGLASSSAGQTYAGHVMHTQVCVVLDWPGQQLVRSDAAHIGRRRRGVYAAKVALTSSSSGQMHNSGQKFMWGN